MADQGGDNNKLPTDYFDRMMGSFTMRNDVVRTEVSVKRVIDIHGNTRTYSVQTFRAEGDGKKGSKALDTVFIEETSADGFRRFVLVPQATEIIARQREIVTTKMRQRGAAKAKETKAAKAGGGK